jgi:ribosome-binding factor A
MPTRRQEKVARVVKEGVSDAIANHLSDPRIEGFVSVTRVELSPDLRNADVYLSIFGGSESSQNKTYEAVLHAKSKIQSLVAKGLKTKFSPVLHIHKDEKFKKTMETLNIIEQAVSKLKESDSENEDVVEESLD